MIRKQAGRAESMVGSCWESNNRVEAGKGTRPTVVQLSPDPLAKRIDLEY